jgi:ATP phosphoribosyltransferase
VLLVRAGDIPEYVQDGVVDCGITGADLVRERAADVTILLELAYGRCSMQAAVPEEASCRTLSDLAGLRVATAYPRLTRDLLANRNISVTLVDVDGSVEVAPRLGLADAIVDLVSSGNTLRTNGLRPLATLFSSQAVLIAAPHLDREAGQLAPILKSVVDGRSARYLMMNTPEHALAKICEIVPGSRSPSVIQLAEPGMVAVHVLVPAADIFRILPRLEAVGASSILVLPVERMLA